MRRAVARQGGSRLFVKKTLTDAACWRATWGFFIKRILAAVGLAVIGAAAMPGGQAAQAAVCVTNYSVSFDIHPIGGGGPPASVSGSICTDGTLGTIWAGNIASWNLSLTNSYNPLIVDFTLSSASATADLNEFLVGTTSPLSATATNLTWTFAVPGPGSYAILEFTDTASGTRSPGTTTISASR